MCGGFIVGLCLPTFCLLLFDNKSVTMHACDSSHALTSMYIHFFLSLCNETVPARCLQAIGMLACPSA
jgi:hypothetical protein